MEKHTASVDGRRLNNEAKKKYLVHDLNVSNMGKDFVLAYKDKEKYFRQKNQTEVRK